MIPNNFLNSEKRYLSVIEAHWCYIEPPDMVNILYPNNPVASYVQSSCQDPVFFTNSVPLKVLGDTLHSKEFKFIDIFSSVSRSFDQDGNMNNLLLRMFKDDNNSTQTNNSFSFRSNQEIL